jgi:hypothetical protein
LPLASHRTGVLNQTGTGKLLADQIAAVAVVGQSSRRSRPCAIAVIGERRLPADP